MDKLDLILQKINSFDARFDRMEERMDAFDARLGHMEERMDAFDTRLGRMEDRMDAVDERLSRVEDDVTGIRLDMENRIVPFIKIIAEGHAFLNRKLDKALEDRGEREQLWLRVVNLEHEVKEIKRHQACTV